MNTLPEQQLISDIRLLIEQSKGRVARMLNQEMTLLYWHIGKRIYEDLLTQGKADYGQQIIVNIAHHLQSEYGKGFSKSNLFEMVRLFESFSNLEIFQTLSGKLSWSHFIAITPLKDKNAQEFYAYMCLKENWSVRQLRSKIHRLLYECSLVSRGDKKEIIKEIDILKNEEILSTDLVLKDPYILDFLHLPSEFFECELEAAILKEIEKFLLEMGSGFTFVARQKRITLEEDHYYIDLLLYNRRLKRLVAVELKAGKFKPAYMGQMQLYLGWLKKYEMMEGEKPPIGIILCTEKSPHQIELLDLDQRGIHVAEYWTELPPLDVFERKVREIVTLAKERLATTKQLQDLKIDEQDS